MPSYKIFARRERRLSDSMQTPNTVRIGLIDAFDYMSRQKAHGLELLRCLQVGILPACTQ
jgi:hypothetical protein